MRDPWDIRELERRFREAAATHHPRAPLYAGLSAGIARTPSLAGLLHHAPRQQRLPVLLFACVHALLLDEPEHELAGWYPNLTDDPRSPADPELLTVFSRFVEDRTPSLLHLLATRRTQTNEVGRCLLLLPPLAAVANEVGPLAMIDVGTSAGLNLLVDRYSYRYELPDGSVRLIGTESPVTLTAGVRGEVALPSSMPQIAARCGVDVAPIDVTSDEAARWLEACVWPDQPERFLRLRSAIGLARATPPEIVQGDAVHSLGQLVDRLGASAHPVVTNSWVLNYLEPGQRSAYVAELARLGRARDLTWVFAESPALTPELPWAAADSVGRRDEQLTRLVVARWRDGQLHTRSIASCHPHGFWLRGPEPG